MCVCVCVCVCVLCVSADTPHYLRTLPEAYACTSAQNTYKYVHALTHTRPHMFAYSHVHQKRQRCHNYAPTTRRVSSFNTITITPQRHNSYSLRPLPSNHTLTYATHTHTHTHTHTSTHTQLVVEYWATAPSIPLEGHISVTHH
jgi:hypothetical protein